MKFVKDGTDVSAIEVGIRNSWKWFWLDEFDNCNSNSKYKDWCRKLEEPGKCFCVLCNKIINYRSSGKKALKSHADNLEHTNRLKAKLLSSKLSGVDVEGVHSKRSAIDTCNEIKSVLGLFLSEHCLPFTMGPELLELAKRLSKNPSALNSVTLSATSAAYNTCHGVAEHVKNEISENLKDTFFSLNLDEATNAAGNKYLNILVQYFSETEEKVIIDLLGSREVNLATASNLFAATKDVLSSRGLNSGHVVSVLMDNCSVMRGIKEGLEAKIRADNPFLLDISGDTIHMINNAAKKFFVSLEADFFSVQTLLSDIYYDIEDSPKVRALFGDIQQALFHKKLSIIRPMPTRFLQMRNVCDRFVTIMDAIFLYYSGFLTEKEHDLKKNIQEEIFLKHEVNEKDQSMVRDILCKQSKQKKTDANLDRKERIVNSLIDNRDKATLAIQLYRGILSHFETFVKLFQSQKPLCHVLHNELFRLVKDFYSMFINSESIPQFSAKKLHSLDFTDVQLQLKDRHLAVGEFCHLELMKCLRNKKKHTWLPSFFKALRKGYIEAARMLHKLPLVNDTLESLLYLDPVNQRSDTTRPALLALAEKLPNVIPETDLGKLDCELRQYTVDDDISMIDADSDDRDFRIDSDWWVPIFRMKRKGMVAYPVLGKLVKGLLSIFCGPIVEGTFNIMGDIIEEDRTRLSSHSYEALAMTKSFLCARKLKSTSMPIPHKMVKCVEKAYSTYGRHLETSRFNTSSAPSFPSSSKSAPSTAKPAPSSNPTAKLSFPSSSKSASLTSAPKSAPLPSVSKSASLTSASKSAHLPSVSKSASLTSAPKPAHLPSVSKSASLTSAPKSAPLTSTSKSAPLPSVSKSAPLTSTPKSAPLPSVSKSAAFNSTPISCSPPRSTSAPLNSTPISSSPPKSKSAPSNNPAPLSSTHITHVLSSSKSISSSSSTSSPEAPAPHSLKRKQLSLFAFLSKRHKPG